MNTRSRSFAPFVVLHVPSARPARQRTSRQFVSCQHIQQFQQQSQQQ